MFDLRGVVQVFFDYFAHGDGQLRAYFARFSKQFVVVWIHYCLKHVQAQFTIAYVFVRNLIFEVDDASLLSLGCFRGIFKS